MSDIKTPSTQVTINAIKTYDVTDGDDSNTWELVFTFKTAESEFEFIATEPYTETIEAWSSLASTEGRRVNLYRGSGDGSITHVNGKFVFRSQPSGAGGDTCSTFTVDRKLVREKLMSALMSACAAGFDFARK